MSALPQIDTHLLMCYHAIFGLGSLLAIDPRSTLSALLREWQLFERGHFTGGRAIRTLTDFADPANFRHILRLFSRHDFLVEYVRRYGGRRLFHRPLATSLQPVDRLKTLHFLVMTDGPVTVGIHIRDFLRAHPTNLLAVGEEIRAYLTHNRPRMPFADLSDVVSRELVFDDEDVARYDTTSQENAPSAADPHTQHARLTLLLSQLAALHKPH